MGLFSNKNAESTEDLLKQSEEALLAFQQEINRIGLEKDSQMKRQVEIWSIASSESNQGMESEYKIAAMGVALNVKKILCLEEHIKKVRLAQFHAKNGDATSLKEALAITDPCSNVTADVPTVDYRPVPSPVDLG